MKTEAMTQKENDPVRRTRGGARPNSGPPFKWGSRVRTFSLWLPSRLIKIFDSMPGRSRGEKVVAAIRSDATIQSLRSALLNLDRPYHGEGYGVTLPESMIEIINCAPSRSKTRRFIDMLQNDAAIEAIRKEIDI